MKVLPCSSDSISEPRSGSDSMMTESSGSPGSNSASAAAHLRRSASITARARPTNGSASSPSSAHIIALGGVGGPMRRREEIS